MNLKTKNKKVRDYSFKSNKGFTLVELLIVVSIIGILSAVVITILNPTQQQNNAKDGTIQASFNKINLAVESHVSAFGQAPSGIEFMKLVNGVTEFSGCETGFSSASQVSCLYSLNGVPLATTCTTGNWRGSGTSSGSDSNGNCYFRYYKNISWEESRYRLYAKTWSNQDNVFAYDNSEDIPGIYKCLATLDLDNVDLSSACEKVNL